MIVCWWWISTQLSKLCCFICSRAKGESTVCVCIGCTCECLICFSVSRLCIDDLMYRTWKLLCVCLHVCDSIMWKSMLFAVMWVEGNREGRRWVNAEKGWVRFKKYECGWSCSSAGIIHFYTYFFFFLKDGDITHWFLGSVDFSVSILVSFVEVKITLLGWDCGMRVIS